MIGYNDVKEVRAGSVTGPMVIYGKDMGKGLFEVQIHEEM